MQLSEELFAEITGVSPTASSDGECDRRLHRRVSFDHRARIFPLMEGVGEDGAPVLVRDISVAGIGFLFSEPIGVGDEFVIRLPTTTQQPLDIQCAARRCEMSGSCGTQFAVGATFELVLNRPLASCIAPESEMLTEQEPLVDQPAPPTIEQRYDRQLVASRLIRPIIRQTRWDRWMARPAVQKCTRILSRIFWPALLVWKGIQSALQAGEEARIRSRLTPNKTVRKTKRKARSAVALPPSTPAIAAQPSAGAQPPLAAIFHPHLFEATAQTPDQTPGLSPAATGSASTAPAATVVGRRSLFSATEISPTASAPPASATEPSAPSTAEQAAAAPAATIDAAGGAAVSSESEQSSVLENTPEPTLVPLPATEVTAATVAPSAGESSEPATTSSPAQPSDIVASPPAEQATASGNADAPSRDVQAASDEQQTAFAETSRAEQSVAKPRRPVAHPRQPRRRPKPAYHR